MNRIYYLRITGFGDNGSQYTLTTATPPAAWSGVSIQALREIPAAIRASVEPFESVGKDAQMEFTLNCAAQFRSTLGPLFQAAPEFITDEAGGTLRLARAALKSDTAIYCHDGDVTGTDVDSEIWVDGECMTVTAKTEVPDDAPNDAYMVTELTVTRGAYGTRVAHHGSAQSEAMYAEIILGVSNSGFVGPEVSSGPIGWSGQEVEFGWIDDTGAEFELFVGVLSEEPQIEGSPLLLRLTANSISMLLRHAVYSAPLAWSAVPPRPDFIGGTSAPQSWDKPLFVSRDQCGTPVWEYARFVQGSRWVILKLGERALVQQAARVVASYIDGVQWVIFNLYAYPLPTAEISSIDTWLSNVFAWGEGEKIHGYGENLFTSAGSTQLEIDLGVNLNGDYAATIETPSMLRDVLRGAERVEYAQPLESTTIYDFIGDELPDGCCLGFDADKYRSTLLTDTANNYANQFGPAFFPIFEDKKFLDLLGGVYRVSAQALITDSKGKLGVFQWGRFNLSLASTTTGAHSRQWELTPGVATGNAHFAPRVVIDYEGFQFPIRDYITSARLPASQAYRSPLEIKAPYYASRSYRWREVVSEYAYGGKTFSRDFQDDDNLEVGQTLIISHTDVPGPTGALGGRVTGQIISCSLNFMTRVKSIVVFVRNWDVNGDRRKGWASSAKVVSWNAGTKVLTLAANEFTTTDATPSADAASFQWGASFIPVNVQLVDKHGDQIDVNTAIARSGNTITMQNAFTATPSAGDMLILSGLGVQEAAISGLSGQYSIGGYAPAFLADEGASTAQDVDGTERQAGRYG